MRVAIRAKFHSIEVNKMKKKNRKNKERYTATTSLGTSTTHSGTAMTRSDTVTIHFDSYNLTLHSRGSLSEVAQQRQHNRGSVAGVA